MRALAIAAAVMFGAAQAAPVTYSMTFKDGAGTVVGTGFYSYDPAAPKAQLWSVNFEEPFIYCDPASPAFCEPGAGYTLFEWTPISLSVLLLGDSWGGSFQEYFLEGSLEREHKGIHYGLIRTGYWSGLNEMGQGWEIDLIARIFSLYSVDLPDPNGLSGTIDFTRVPEIPAPAAFLLFPIGLAAFMRLKRRS